MKKTFSVLLLFLLLFTLLPCQLGCGEKPGESPKNNYTTRSKTVSYQHFNTVTMISTYGTTTESDLDGTLIAGQRLRAYMHSVFGVPASHDYYVQYNDEFWERIKNKPPVVKTLPRPKEHLAPKAVVELIEAQKAAEAK